jgi:anthranilate/para-aminobenzoate synthase component II
MLLVLNNHKPELEKHSDLSFIVYIRKALKHLKIPFIETNKIDMKIHKMKISAILISGSPMKISGPLKLEDYVYILHYLSVFHEVPVMGMCFGCQFLALVHGLKVKNQKKYHCSDDVVELSEHRLFRSLPRLQVMHFCFSDLVLSDRKSDVKELAWFLHEGKIHPCAFEFTDNRFGTMFHPEYEKDTYEILSNFYHKKK